VHSTRKSQRGVQIYGVFSPPSHCTGCRAPRCKKNEHIDNLRGKRPMIGPIFLFFTVTHILTLNVVRLSHTLQHFLSSCLSHLFIYMVAVNATISSELLNARSLTRGRIHDVTLRPTYVHVKKFNAKQAKSSSFIVISLA